MAQYILLPAAGRADISRQPGLRPDCRFLLQRHDPAQKSARQKPCLRAGLPPTAHLRLAASRKQCRKSACVHRSLPDAGQAQPPGRAARAKAPIRADLPRRYQSALRAALAAGWRPDASPDPRQTHPAPASTPVPAIRPGQAERPAATTGQRGIAKPAAGFQKARHRAGIDSPQRPHKVTPLTSPLSV